MPTESSHIDIAILYVSDTVYIYQAALLCDDCGTARIEHLEKKGAKDDGDSDSFPQGPHGNGGGESDYPGFCDNNAGCVNALELPDGSKIGAPLGNPLTDDGVKKLVSDIKIALHSHRLHSRLIGRLYFALYIDWLPSDLESLGGNEKSIGRSGETIDDTILAIVQETHRGVVNRIYDDLNHVYAIGWENAYQNLTDKKPSGNERFAVWRTTAQTDGSFSDLEAVYLPASEARERSPEDILRELIEEDAWG